MRGIAFLVALIACGLAAAPVRGDVITELPTRERVVALTFDACSAGGEVAFDPLVLNYLLSREIPFTVFASGKFVERNVDVVRHLSQLGFVDIENHSWNHPNTMHRFDAASVVAQVERGQAAIESATGRRPQFFRFPAGNYNEEGLKAVEALGYKVVHWRWATGDPDPSERAQNLHRRTLSSTRPGDILIFHINGRGVHTGEALPGIVEALKADGYRFVLLSDYLGEPRAHSHYDQAAHLARRALDGFLRLAPAAALSRTP